MIDNTSTFEEHVRRRPAMFIGNDYVINLLRGLIIACKELSKTDQITFEITIVGENDFKLSVNSTYDMQAFWQSFNTEVQEFTNFLPRVLKIVSSKFETKSINNSTSELYFSLNKEIIKDTSLDYWQLLESMSMLSILNRRSEIITIDKTQKHVNQNYFHFPQGIFYYFEKAVSEALGKPEFILKFDGAINDHFYQIGLAYRSDWYPQPNIVSFANDVHLEEGGALIDGVLQGLQSACKSYVKQNQLSTYKITRKKFTNGLILVCAVRGQELQFGRGNILEDDSIKKEVKKLIEQLASDFFVTQPENAAKFLWRFDTTQMGSVMY